MPAFVCMICPCLPLSLISARYLESLETQMSEMRTLLNKYRALYPDAELSDDLNRIVSGSSPFAEPASAGGSPRPSSSQAPPSIMSPLSPVSAMDSNDAEPEFDPSDDEITARNNLAKNFDNLSIHQDNFLGKSSSMMFLQAALESKQDYVTGGPPSIQSVVGAAHGDGVPLATFEAKDDKGKGKLSREDTPTAVKIPINLLETKRIEYWQEQSVRSYYSSRPDLSPLCVSGSSKL